MGNPFQYSAPLAPEDLLDRDEEASQLVERAVGGHNSRLVAPRRFGKTSLLRRVARDITDEGWAAVYVNFFGVLSSADIAERIDRSYGTQLTGRLAAWFSGMRRVLRPTVRAGGGPLPASAEVAMEPAEHPALLERLALPRKLHEQRGTRVLVIFDEFQDVLSAGGRMDAVIRSEIEQHGAAASYVFAGSHVGMMRELFADRRRAFYGQAGPVELGPLAAPDVAEHLAGRFEATGKRLGAALDPLLETAQGHPQRTMLLAHWLWESTGRGREADEHAWARAYDRVMEAEVRDELRASWTALPVGQRKLLTAIAEGERQLFGRAAQARYGLPRGGGLRTSLQALLDRGEVAEDGDALRVVDPLLARWVRQGRPA